jgi:uncharacterized 2Fe-2S/4Fe-4S cluster protein (DUF4445 family)
VRTHQLKLWPADLRWDVPHGTPLQDALFPHGVEFPCGGRGRCKGCRVKVLHGALEVTPEESARLTRAELEQGWRMACRHAMSGELTLELAQWEMPVLGDSSTTPPFTPREGLGVAIDLGTTTLAAQLLELKTGNVLSAATALNAQAQRGADIMSRVDYATRAGGDEELRRLIRDQLGQMVTRLQQLANTMEPVTRVVIVGNSVMHHLFCDVSVAPLATHPFEPEQGGRFRFTPAQLGWSLPNDAIIEFLPCLGGFVGSDILAGIMATQLHESSELTALLDLGTNGEVVVGNRNRILCASTAAGPAFEGARITMGMRAATGAICAVEVEGGDLKCRVIGGGTPRGLCGSGLVDAVAAGLRQLQIQPNGRMTNNAPLSLTGPVTLHPQDIRELQLAKGAIAAGLRILTAHFGASLNDLGRVHLAGAFGNYINRLSAQRIGLLRVPLERVVAAGNTALRGAKQALFEEAAGWDAVASRVTHVSLNEDPAFQDIYAEEMQFPR